LLKNQQNKSPIHNASLSRAKLTASGEEVGENIMAATPACTPGKRIPGQ
jgi:hypothetical protein